MKFIKALDVSIGYSSVRRSGFTIVELLIVIVVIGILAAISVAAYNGIQNRAYDSTVKQDLSNAAKLIAQFKVDETNGRYPHTLNRHEMTFLPAGLADALPELELSRSAYTNESQGVDQNFLYCRNGNWQNYSIVAQSRSGNIFYVSSDGVVEGLSSAWSDDPHVNCRAVVDDYNTSYDGVTGEYEPAYWAGNGFNGTDWREWAHRG